MATEWSHKKPGAVVIILVPDVPGAAKQVGRLGDGSLFRQKSQPCVSVCKCLILLMEEIRLTS